MVSGTRRRQVHPTTRPPVEPARRSPAAAPRMPWGGSLHPTDALGMQRLAGNRATAQLIGRTADDHPRRDTAPVDTITQRVAAVDATARTTAGDEQALVRQWHAESGQTENQLTDRVYFHRHPEAQGTRLAPGSPAAAEWLDIRQTVVRPALTSAPATPTGQAPAGHQAPATEPATADPIQAALTAGKDLFEFAHQVGGSMIDAVAGFLGVGPETVQSADRQQPEVVVDVPPEAPATTHQRGDAFKNQRDNESAHVEAGVSCSPTSFTMALIDLHGGDEETVRLRATELIKERGGNTKYTQTEELIIELLQVVDWTKATAEKPAYFWEPQGWAAWAAKTYGGRYYKDPNAQQYVASLFPKTGGSSAETYAGAYTHEQWAPVIKALAGGAVATAQGGFTSSGHVVDIVDATDAGVTINDPYGLWLKGTSYQIKNGEKAPVLGASDRTTLERRATTNPELLAMYERSTGGQAADGIDAWGRRNFYSWDDVQAVKLGKWISVLRAG